MITYAESAEQEINRVLGVVSSFSPLLQATITVLFILVFLYFFWGLADYIRKDNATLENAKKRMIWGIVGIFVLVSMWGLIFFLQKSILGTRDTTKPDIEFRKVDSI